MGISHILFSPSLKYKMCGIQHFYRMNVGHHNIPFREIFIDAH